MINIEEISILPKYPSEILVEWKLFNPVNDSNHLFWIYLSDNPEHGFEKINTLPIINESHFSFSYPLLFKQEYLYIKVECIQEGIPSKPYTFTSKVSYNNTPIIKEMIRRLDLLRKKKTGIECKVRKRKLIGERCTNCIDPVTGFIISSTCDKCYGTKIINGYSEPIETYIEIVEGERAIKPSEVGMTENILANASFTYPLVFKGDIIIETQRNKRWMVDTVKRSMLQTFTVDQTALVGQLSPKDIEYSIQ